MNVMAKETRVEKEDRIREANRERRAEEAEAARDAVREEAATAAAEEAAKPKKRVSVIEDGHTVVKEV